MLHREYIAPAISLILASKYTEAFNVYKTLMELLRQNYMSSSERSGT